MLRKVKLSVFYESYLYLDCHCLYLLKSTYLERFITQCFISVLWLSGCLLGVKINSLVGFEYKAILKLLPTYLRVFVIPVCVSQYDLRFQNSFFFTSKFV